MGKLAIAIVAGSALLGGVTAHAADMAVKALPIASPPAFSCTGFYIGETVGGAWTPSTGGSDFGPLFPPFAILPPLVPVFRVSPANWTRLPDRAAGVASSAAARSDNWQV
jgi:outer membrane immunogenic protein